MFSDIFEDFLGQLVTLVSVVRPILGLHYSVKICSRFSCCLAMIAILNTRRFCYAFPYEAMTFEVSFLR